MDYSQCSQCSYLFKDLYKKSEYMRWMMNYKNVETHVELGTSGNTLQSRFGFQDNELTTPRHDEIAAILDLDPEIEVWRAVLGGSVRNVRLPGTRTWIDAT